MINIKKILLPDKTVKNEFATINNKILNYALLISTIFSIPAIIGMYFRSKTIGLELFIILQFVLWIILFLLYLFRDKIIFKIRFICYIGCVIALIFLAVFNVGALGFWSQNIIFISLIISIFYHRKYAFYVLISLTAIIIFISHLFLTKKLHIGFDPLPYINSSSIWIAMIMTFIYTSVIIIFLVSMQRDYFISSIHQLTNANEKAILSENKFRNIFNSSTDAFVISNFEGQILEVNNAMLNFIGYVDDNLYKKNLNDFILPEYQNIVKERSKSLAYLKVLPLLEILVKNAKSDVVPVELNTMLIDYNNEKAIFSVVRDITERKKLEQKILSTIIQTEERERSRFAKEIHDGVGPLLSATKIYAKALQKADNEEELLYILLKLNETVDEAIISAQEIANNISPHILQNFGLKGAIESFYQKINKTSSIIFNFSSNIEERIDENIETTLYRVVVELINNSIKYANAKSISTILTKDDGHIYLSYSDDGIGFDVKKTVKQNTGMGISNIESRIKSLNGQIQMKSETHNGFNVEIKIAIK